MPISLVLFLLFGGYAVPKLHVIAKGHVSTDKTSIRPY